MTQKKNWKYKLFFKYNNKPRFSSYLTLKNLNNTYKFYHTRKLMKLKISENHLYRKKGTFFFTRKYVKYNKK